MATTAGVKMTFTKGDKSWTKALNGMNASKISDATVASSFVGDYAVLVDGELTAAEYTKSEPVDID